MVVSDSPQLQELSISVTWPHRPEDWELAIRHGHGLVARDEIERVVGSGMWSPMGENYAAIGMVITSPRLQEHGTGRWLMNLLMEQTGDRGLVLTATRAAYRLYLSLGFVPVVPVFQHHGEVTARPDLIAISGLTVRPKQPEDRAAILALDEAAFGLPRVSVLHEVFDVSRGMVLEKAGRVIGFALCRRFGRGHVIGPVVAENEAEVLALVSPIVAEHHGQFLRMDTSVPEGHLRQFLVAHGLTHYDTVTRMALGKLLPVPQGAARTFGLINQFFG
jgi:GNAT superfamily N-acetyltransferase